MKREILLVQPPLLHPEMYTDKIQKQYWSVLKTNVNRLVAEISEEIKLNEFESNFTGFIEPNIGLLYVGACLKQANFEVKYLDLHLLDLEIRQRENCAINDIDIENALKNYSSSFIGISPLTINFHWAVKIANIYKNLHSQSISILGGIHVTFVYDSILKKYKCIDYIIVGEGEYSTINLLEHLLKGKDISDVKGVAYRKKNCVYFTGVSQEVINLDELPYPDYSLLDKKYLTNCMLRVIASRGCVNKCSFCAPSSFFINLSFRNYKKVIDELEYLKNTYDNNFFMIGDLNFLNDYDYSKNLCNEIIKRKLNIYWMCQCRINLINEEIVDLMKRAGCKMICLGMESGNQNILNKSKKAFTISHALNACKIVKNAGIYLFTFWVFGLPGETHESASQSIQLLRKMLDQNSIDYTHCTVCTPYPGTDLAKDPDKYGIKIISYNYSKYWMGCDYLGADLPVMETRELSIYEIYAYWQLALATVGGNLYGK